MIRILLILVVFAFLYAYQLQAQNPASTGISYQHPIEFAPNQYVCHRTDLPIDIDGKMDDPAWENADWTADFVDIEGHLKPKPSYRTRAKMLWDSQYFYFAAILEEPQLWATLQERDAVMYQNDDFEIFIDPDGDGQLYYEFEMNAHNAIWDLFMIKPYRVDDGQPKYLTNWDIKGIQTAVHLEGTLNNPEDEDRYWSVEIAMPWKALKEMSPKTCPPTEGDQWRVNFSRVDWHLDIVDGHYRKKLDPKTGKEQAWPEENWVWSPSGRVDMHQVETWGYVQFTSQTGGAVAFEERPAEQVKWALWQMYHQQRLFFEKNKQYSENIRHFNLPEVAVEGYRFVPSLYVTASMFEVVAPALNGEIWHINQEGKLWKSP
ncbi:MAG TPA: carbohydrate-binding family 9-like protein [Saprospiraceae bacterium]|nr:carbohydrate-binding family 9-like protein [Saprospiraceae bacterium]HMQ81871.1 carbohydrate-binding family 9-like protein [Saprospiraceae bacterium]